MEIKKSEEVLLYLDTTCSQHGSYATYILIINDIIIPLCDDCLKNLKEIVNKVLK